MGTQRWLYTHGATRIYPMSHGSNDRWLVVNLMSKRSFQVPTISVMILTAFMGGNEVSRAIDDVCDWVETRRDQLSKVTDQLAAFGLLVPEDNPDHLLATKISRDWNSFGWIESVDHHLATFDYPFEDYSTNGGANDRALMLLYASSSPDIDRGKRYETVQQKHLAPTAKEALATLTVPFRNAWDRTEPQDFTADRLLALMSIAFGQLRSRRVAPEGRAPLVRKTSPSGGSRHPTEGYVVVRKVSGLDGGIYHFCVGTNEVVKINDLPPDDVLSDWFPGLMRAPFEPAAFIVLTTVFERNMYRYREPRTFRTLFMDAGHLCCTIETAARGLGLLTWVQHGIDDGAFEEAIGAHYLSEGAIVGIAIAGKRSDD